MYKSFYKLKLLLWGLPRLKLVFWLGKIKTFISIVIFLITVVINLLIYVAIWSCIFFTSVNSVDNIYFNGRDRFNLKLPAPSIPNLNTVIMFVFPFFASFTSSFIG